MTTNALHIQATLADRASAFFAELAEGRRRYALYRQTLSELNALSDREAADLGLSRADFANLAHEAAYKK